MTQNPITRKRSMTHSSEKSQNLVETKSESMETMQKLTTRAQKFVAELRSMGISHREIDV